MDVTSFKIDKDSALRGCTLKEADLRNMYGTTVLAIKRGEQIIENPAGDTQLMTGDQCIVLGKPERLCQLKISLEGESEGQSQSCSI